MGGPTPYGASPKLYLAPLSQGHVPPSGCHGNHGPRPKGTLGVHGDGQGQGNQGPEAHGPLWGGEYTREKARIGG